MTIMRLRDKMGETPRPGLEPRDAATTPTMHRQEARPMSTTEERFWSKVNKDGPTTAHMESPCWVWVGPKSFGYGRTGLDGRKIWAHRFSWEAHRGPIPPNLRVLHRCDDRACVRPDHLFLGTQADNMRDMVAKGRHAASVHPERVVRGEAHGCAKLDEGRVRSIRAALASGEAQASIARRFQCSLSTVNAISTGRLWRSVA